MKQALEKNLSIRFSERNYSSTEAGIVKAKAIKDPIFNVAIMGSQTDTFDRREYIVRKRFIESQLQYEIQGLFAPLPPQDQSNPQAQQPFGVLFAPPPSNPTQQPDATYTVYPLVNGFTERGAFDYASFRARERVETATVSYLHQLPWGPMFSMSLSSKHDVTLFENTNSEDSISFANPNDPNSPVFNTMDQNGNLIPRKTNLVMSAGTPNTAFFQSGTRLSDWYQQPWSSTLTLQLTVPIPYAKDWGPNGSAEVPLKLAKVAQVRAYWQLQSVINSTLLNVNTAHWEVVRAIRRLEVIAANGKSLAQIAKQTDDLLKLNRVTDYEVDQAKTALKSAQGAEEGAWAAYVSASNALKNLLSYDRDVVLLPVNYAGDLAGGITFQAADVLPLAMAGNPDLRIAKTDLENASVNLAYAHNQVRPDLKLTSGMTWSQSSQVFGYSNYYDSLSHLMHPDQRNGFVALNFRMPWGNRPFEDTLKKTEQQYKQSDKNLSSVAGTVTKNVNDAVAAVLSSREQAAMAWKNVQTAEQVLKSVSELWEMGRVPDPSQVKNSPTFTLLTKNNDYLSARLLYIEAQIALKEAEGRLLAAQGLIAARYADELKIMIKPVVEPQKEEGTRNKSSKKTAEKEGCEACRK